MGNQTNQKNAKKRKENQENLLKRRRRSILIVMGEIALCLFLGIGCFVTNMLNSYAYEELDGSVYKAEATSRVETQVIEVTNEQGTVIDTKEVEVVVEGTDLTGYRNILIVGLDARSQDSFDPGVQSDVMIVASINNDTGEVKLVSILRDTIMKMEDGTGAKAYDKANAQFAASGIADTVSMVNRNLDLNIDEYVIVNWYGVGAVINEIGGIELEIPNKQILDYFNGYLTEVNSKTGLWAPQLQAPGTYVMTGPQVVAFCRIRYGGYNDTGRANNQREAIAKILEKVKTLVKCGDISTVLNAAEVGLSNVKTNLKTPEVLYLATNATRYSVTETQQFPQSFVTSAYVGNYPGKYNVIDPIVANDFAAEVTELHRFLFNDDNYVPSEFVRNIGYQMQLDKAGQ